MTSTQQDPRLPPPSAPVTDFAQAVQWLEGEAQRVIRAALRRMKDGTAAFPPQIGIGYEAFWLRDYERISYLGSRLSYLCIWGVFGVFGVTSR